MKRLSVIEIFWNSHHNHLTFFDSVFSFHNLGTNVFHQWPIKTLINSTISSHILNGPLQKVLTFVVNFEVKIL